MADQNTPRGQWPKALIEETFPDSEGLVRTWSLERHMESTVEMCESSVCWRPGEVTEPH